MGFYAFLPPEVAFARAKRAAEMALGLGDDLAEAHVSMALVHFWFDWDWAAAEREFRRGLALHPRLVHAHMYLGQLLAATGRAEEAVAAQAAALELDPLSPLTHGIVASGLFFSRRYEAAWARCRRALDLEPGFVQSLWAGSLVAGDLCRHGEAIEMAERAAELSGRSPLFVASLGLVLARAGRRDQARALLAELEARAQREYVAPLFRAWVLTGLGEREDTLACLERAFEERNCILVALAGWSDFDWLRGDPRFERILQRMNLTPH